MLYTVSRLLAPLLRVGVATVDGDKSNSLSKTLSFDMQSTGFSSNKLVRESWLYPGEQHLCHFHYIYATSLAGIYSG